MLKCSCGHTFKPTKDNYLGEGMGMDFHNCPECNSTRVLKTHKYYIERAVMRAMLIKTSIEELEEYLEIERKAAG